jgi:hypothetical protein
MVRIQKIHLIHTHAAGTQIRLIAGLEDSTKNKIRAADLKGIRTFQ